MQIISSRTRAASRILFVNINVPLRGVKSLFKPYLHSLFSAIEYTNGYM